MRIGAAQRKLSLNNVNHFWRPPPRASRASEWIRRLRDTVLPQGAHVWYKNDDELSWLGQISASTIEGGVYLIRFQVDPRLIKLLLPSARYTNPTGTVRGSWYLQVYVDVGCNVT